MTDEQINIISLWLTCQLHLCNILESIFLWHFGFAKIKVLAFCLNAITLTASLGRIYVILNFLECHCCAIKYFLRRKKKHELSTDNNIIDFYWQPYLLLMVNIILPVSHQLPVKNNWWMTISKVTRYYYLTSYFFHLYRN